MAGRSVRAAADSVHEPNIFTGILWRRNQRGQRKVCSLDGDELEIQTALGGTFRLTDQMAVKPDEYTMGSTVRVEYLGERITGYLVRVTELAE